ncbi:MAG: hypothetical protein ABR587_09835 [Candidatus Binatia bacterium]
MRRFLGKTGLYSSLLAVFLISGGHWMVLQSVAWSRMFAANARTDTLVLAVAKTFDSEHRCGMCHQIQRGRENEQRPTTAIAANSASPRVWMMLPACPQAGSILSYRAIALLAEPTRDIHAEAPPDPPPRTA